jgi:predicted phosphoadenosine phosphosulfate sulfurtransferase
MQIFNAGQNNTVKLDIVAKSSGDPIVSGTVNFYLKAVTGDNAGKYFRASDSSWQEAESSAGVATYDGGSAWSLVIVAAAWESGVDYRLYAKESGNLNIIYDVYFSGVLSRALRITKAFSVMKMSLKSGTTYEILDPDDGVTVIAELTTNTTSPPTIEIKI